MLFHKCTQQVCSLNPLLNSLLSSKQVVAKPLLWVSVRLCWVHVAIFKLHFHTVLTSETFPNLKLSVSRRTSETPRFNFRLTSLKVMFVIALLTTLPTSTSDYFGSKKFVKIEIWLKTVVNWALQVENSWEKETQKITWNHSLSLIAGYLVTFATQ